MRPESKKFIDSLTVNSKLIHSSRLTPSEQAKRTNVRCLSTIKWGNGSNKYWNACQDKWRTSKRDTHTHKHIHSLTWCLLTHSHKQTVCVWVWVNCLHIDDNFILLILKLITAKVGGCWLTMCLCEWVWESVCVPLEILIKIDDITVISYLNGAY